MLVILQTSVDLSTIAKQTVQLITPEIVLLIFACGALVFDTLLSRAQKRAVAWLSLAGVAASFLSLILLYTAVLSGINSSRTALFDMLVIDHYAFFFKAVFLIGAAVAILLSIPSADEEGHGTYYPLMLFVVTGMMFMASSVDLLAMFVSLELMAVALYVLAAYFRRAEVTHKAALRYFLFGAFSSAILLYGISLLYGLAGSTNLASVITALPILTGKGYDPLGVPADVRYLVLIAVILMAVGLSFKVVAAPFHIGEPDIYEESPAAVTAFLSVSAKVASFALFGRLFLYGLADLRGTLVGDPANNTRNVPGWAVLLGGIAAITMIWGNLAALRQKNVKRLLAYSSIAQAGYVLLGLLAGNERGYNGFLIHLLAYTLMNLGAFGCLLAVRRAGVSGENIEDWNGLRKRSLLLTILMTIFLASLIGIPLTAGFIGKYYLFRGLIETHNRWLLGLAILAIVMSVVSIIYYFKLIRAMFKAEASDSEMLGESAPLKAALIFCAVLLLAIGILPQRFVALTERAMAVYKTYDYSQARTVGAGSQGGASEKTPLIMPGAK